MVVDNNGASVDEASILANFFNLQADKHGPELLRKLNRIGAERRESVQSQQSNEEQRHEIKIEVEAENVIKHEVKLDQERSQAGALNPMSHNKPDSGLVLHSVANPGISFLVKNESDGGSNRQIQYVMSQDGKLLSMLPDAFLNSLPLLPNQEDKSQGFSARQDVNQCGSVSVIQRAPPKFAQKCAKFELNNPNIILERRVHLGEVGSGGNTLANVANMANSTGSIPGTRVRLPNGETRRQIDTQNQNVTGAGSRSTLQSLIGKFFTKKSDGRIGTNQKLKTHQLLGLITYQIKAVYKLSFELFMLLAEQTKSTSEYNAIGSYKKNSSIINASSNIDPFTEA